MINKQTFKGVLASLEGVEILKSIRGHICYAVRVTSQLAIASLISTPIPSATDSYLVWPATLALPAEEAAECLRLYNISSWSATAKARYYHHSQARWEHTGAIPVSASAVYMLKSVKVLTSKSGTFQEGVKYLQIWAAEDGATLWKAAPAHIQAANKTVLADIVTPPDWDTTRRVTAFRLALTSSTAPSLDRVPHLEPSEMGATVRQLYVLTHGRNTQKVAYGSRSLFRILRNWEGNWKQMAEEYIKLFRLPLKADDYRGGGELEQFIEWTYHQAPPACKADSDWL